MFEKRRKWGGFLTGLLGNVFHREWGGDLRKEYLMREGWRHRCVNRGRAPVAEEMDSSVHGE